MSLKAKKIPLHIMNSSAIYEICKIRELLTCCNLAKFAISRSNDTGIPLPTHFSKSQFTIAAMDNFDHSDFNSLTGTAATHDTAMTLFQTKLDQINVVV